MSPALMEKPNSMVLQIRSSRMCLGQNEMWPKRGMPLRAGYRER